MTLAVSLLVVAFGLVMVEIAIPSFGLLGLLAAGAYTWSVVLAFGHSGPAGWSFVAIGVLLLPVAIGLGLKVLPRTPVGRRLVLRAPPASEIAHGTRPAEDRDLVGQSGVAVTALRPTGIARIGDQRIDVVAGGRYLHKGTAVVVNTVEGNRIVVEELETERKEK